MTFTRKRTTTTYIVELTYIDKQGMKRRRRIFVEVGRGEALHNQLAVLSYTLPFVKIMKNKEKKHKLFKHYAIKILGMNFLARNSVKEIIDMSIESAVLLRESKNR